MPATPEGGSREVLHMCLVCDSPEVRASVAASCTAPHRVTVYPLEGLIEPKGTVSRRLEEIAAAAGTADAVLVEWDIYKAPLIGTLSYRLRSTAPPLIALCPDDQEDQAAALVVGADRTAPLPVRLSFVKAQIIAHMRSLQGDAAASSSREGVQPAAAPARTVPEPAGGAAPLRLGLLSLDLRGYRFSIRDQQVKLTPRQFALVAFLMRHVDVVLTREQILDEVWGIHFDTGTNMVDVYIHFLRRILKANGLTPSIETVRGMGYRFTKPEPLE